MTTWTKTFYGWTAMLKGNRLTVRRYRRGDGRGFVYVAAVNTSSRHSPAQAWASLAAAKADAVALASQ